MEADSIEELIATAAISKSDQRDPDVTNNRVSVVFNQDVLNHPSVADLAVKKTVNQDGVDVGEDAAFMVLVRNNGPGDANNVVLEDILPAGMSFISSETSQGAYSEQTGIWNVGTIPPGSYALMNVSIRIIGADLAQNIAEIDSLDEFDPNPLNDVSAAGINIGADLSVVTPASATEGDGIVQGTVSIPGTLGPDLIVALTSSDTTEATVPATVTILAGQTSANFDITILDDNLVDGNQKVSITASADGWTSGTDEIDVLDNEQKALSVNVPASATEGVGKVQGTVSIPGALGTDLIVTLSSSDTSEATVPATVTIPAGQISTTFDITIVDDEEADGTQTVIITASASGWTSGAATMEVRDNDSPNDCPPCSGETPEVHDVTFKDGMDCVCVGRSSMTIGPNVAVKKGARVIFKAPRITVISGVHAAEGAVVEMKQE